MLAYLINNSYEICIVLHYRLFHITSCTIQEFFSKHFLQLLYDQDLSQPLEHNPVCVTGFRPLAAWGKRIALLVEFEMAFISLTTAVRIESLHII